MAIACGIDIENKKRLERLLNIGLFPKDIFRESEWKDIQSDDSSICLYFTFKEAMLKALGFGWFNLLIVGNDIEVRLNKGNNVGLKLFGMFEDIFLTRGYQRIKVSQFEFDNNMVTEIIIGKDKYRDPIHCRTIIDIEEVKKSLFNTMGSNSLPMNPLKTLTKIEERKYCQSRMAGYIAGRMAAKHSIASLIKKIDESVRIEAYDLEIMNDTLGRPFVNNSWKLKLPVIPAFSVSHSKQYAISVAATYL